MTNELMERVQRRQAERFKILQALYQRHHNGEVISRLLWLANDTGIDVNVADEHVSYLLHQGFVEFSYGTTEDRDVELLHAGEVEVERVLSGQGTPNFPVYIQNMITVGSISQSQIQQGTQQSSATLNITNFDDHRQEFQTFFHSIRESSNRLGLDEETRQELEEDLETGESQLSRKKPNAGVLREVLKSVRTIFEGAGGALAAQYLPQIGELMKILGG